jgi:hypothetical protein
MRWVAAAAVAALVAAASPGCGDDDGAALAWDVTPQVVRHPEIPNDVLATGRIRNDSDDELRLDTEDARVIDANGRPLEATVRFAAGYTHALYPPGDAPRETPRKQRERLGDAATIRPGATAPLTAAWHRRRDARAVRIEIGDESLALPAP